MKIKIIMKIIIYGLIIPAMLGASILAAKAYYSPLGSDLQIPTVAVELSGVQPIPSATPIPESAQGLVCGESGVWNVLVLGVDSTGSRGNAGTDFVRMMRVDFPNRQVTQFAFPPDLWVNTSGLGLINPATQSMSMHLGTVFHEASGRSTYTAAKDVMLDGTYASATVLFQNFDVSTNFYLTVDLSQVPMMVDAVGGVPINVPQTITDPWIGITIPAGPQTLNGTQFVAYARAIPDSDFARMQRHDLLMGALREKLLDPAMWEQIPQLYAQFNGMIATNFSPEQINHLNCLLKEVPAGMIVREGIKQEWTSPGPVPDSLYWEKTQVLNQLRILNFIP